MVVRLVNVDGVASKKSSNRVLDCWMQDNGTNLRLKYWRNDMISDLNPHSYNRLNVYYANHKNNTVLQSYYCIHDCIQFNEMTFDNFDESVLV